MIEGIPKLGQCYLCKGWSLEKDLKSIDIPDQGAGYVRKLACGKCLDKIMARSGLQDALQEGKNERGRVR